MKQMKHRIGILALAATGALASIAFAQHQAQGAATGPQPSPSATDQAQPRAGASTAERSSGEARSPSGTNLSSARERLGVGTTDPAATGTTRSLAVSELEGREVRNLRGENLGNVHRVVTGPDGKHHIVISHGGLLGIGSDRAAFPIERFQVDGDRLTVRGVSEQDIESASNARDVDAWPRVDGNQAIQMGSVG